MNAEAMQCRSLWEFAHFWSHSGLVPHELLVIFPVAVSGLHLHSVSEIVVHIVVDV